MLDDSSLVTIKKILSKYLPTSEYKAFIFGSRAAGTSRKFSDIDLGISGPTPIDRDKLTKINFDLEDSDIPYIVDVVDFSSVSDKFKQTALQNAIYI